MTFKIDKISILLLLYFQVSLNAQQVGIGTLNPNPNSALDVVSTDKGILIPRISDTSAVSKIDGALFYHDGEHAFYYCQENKWQRFAPAQRLVDADGDTYLEALNHAANEDSIVGVFNGNLRVVMKENSNQDFVLETFSEDGNLFIGEQAGSQISADISESPIRNIGIGVRALQKNVFGADNVALGFESLANSVGVSGTNVSGDGNTAIGSKSLTLNTQGFFNVAVGTNAMLDNEDGARNVSVGYGSLLSNTTGINNTAIGFGALSSNIVGNYNTAYGFDALLFNTADNNVAIGAYAAFNNKANSTLTAIGYEAMRNANNSLSTILVNSTAVGYQALKGAIDPANNIGINNTALGHQVLTNNSAGNGNVGIGAFALLNNIGTSGTNISGDDNVAIGYESMKENTQGFFNVAIGTGSAKSNLDGGRNVGIGYSSLFNNLGGGNNTATGFAALADNEDGNHNAAYGSNALQKNKGDQNVGLGSFSLWLNETGTGNVSIGYKAGYSETGSNKLYIHNDDANAENALIYGEFDQALLSLNAEVSIKDSLHVSDAGITFTNNKTITQALGIKYIISFDFNSFSSIIGEIRLFGGSTIPSGYLACDGASYIITDYQDLYDVIGTTYGEGNNPGTTFNVPDLRKAVPVHQD